MIQNTIRLYGLIWVHCLSVLQGELEGDSYCSTHFPIYDCLWLFTNINIFTSGIDHTSNWCYYGVMVMRSILCLKQGGNEPTKAYYQSFEASISTSDP